MRLVTDDVKDSVPLTGVFWFVLTHIRVDG